MTYLASGFGRTRRTISRTGTPSKRLSSRDQRVTQWMSHAISARGRAWNSSQLQLVSSSTRPKQPNDLVEEPVAGDDLARVLDQVAQQVELLAGEPHLPPALEGLARPQVHPHVAERELLELLPRAGPAEHGPDARHQLAQAERLGDVVV